MKRIKFSKKLLIWIALIVAVIAIGTVVAYLFAKTNVIRNVFDIPYVQCEVEETFDDTTGVKSSIQIENTGNIDAYLRLRLISYWKDGEGNIVGKPSSMPAISYDSDNWIKGNGNTYYYKSSVAPHALTVNLLPTSPVTLRTDTFFDQTVYQVLEVIPEAVQAQPAGAATSLWGVTIETDGVITAAPGSTVTP